MEGITDAGYRRLVLTAGGVGIACTDYLRLHSGAPTRAMMRRRYYGADITNADDCQPPATPVGVQFMASEPTWLATAARKAEAMGRHLST